MARWLVAILMVAGISLTAPPAHSVMTVSLTASRTSLMLGQTVTLTGSVARARVGSVVALQRKVGTSWRTVVRTTLTTSRSYSFRVTPPRDYQSYRVHKPRQLGQASATSAAVRLAVRWRPSIRVVQTLPGVWPQTATHEVEVSPAPPDAPLYQQHRYHPDAGWITYPNVTATVPGWAPARMSIPVWWVGYEARYFIPGSGLRLPAYSAAVGVPDDAGSTGGVVHLNETTEQRNRLSSGAFHATYGTRVRVAVDNGSNLSGVLASVYDSAGGLVARTQDGVAGFVVRRPGWHTVLLSGASQYDSSRVTISTPLRVATSLNAPIPWLETLPGQVSQYSFTGQAGQFVSGPGLSTNVYCDSADGAYAEMSHAGEGFYPVVFGLTRYATPPVWRLPENGTYVLTVTPCRTNTARSQGLFSSAVIDVGPSETPWVLDIPTGSHVAGRLFLDQGERMVVTGALTSRTSNEQRAEVTVVAPDGRAMPLTNNVLVAQESGIHHVLLTGMDFSLHPVDYAGGATLLLLPPVMHQLSRIGQQVRVDTLGHTREVGLAFPAEAGEVVVGDLAWYTQGNEQVLVDAAGNAVPPTYEAFRPVWRIPSTGTFRLMALGNVANLPAATAHPVRVTELAADGTTQTFTLHRGDTLLSDLDLTAGTRFRFSVGDASTDDFHYRYFGASLTSESGQSVATLGSNGETAQEFTVPTSGRYTLIIQGRGPDYTGDVQVALSPL